MLGMEFLFGMTNILQLIVVTVAHLCEYTKNQQIVCLNVRNVCYMNCISVELLKKKNMLQLESDRDGLKLLSIFLISDLQNKGILQKLGVFIMEGPWHAWLGSQRN